jgi:disulfide bond formation protein DsbB
MYPLVAIIGAGIILKDARLRFYALPLSVSGIVISVYHNLLYYKVIPDSIKPCTSGVSCTAKQIEWFGFITIPLLALTAFFIINVLLLLDRQANKSERN